MKKNRILIFDTESGGHHVEYIHHLLMKANLSCDEYVFCLPDCYMQIQNGGLEWKCRPNVRFHYFDKGVIKRSKFRFFRMYDTCRLLKDVVDNYSITHVFFIVLISLFPLLPFFIPKGVGISGIVYQIYFYTWNTTSLVRKLIEVIRNFMLVKCACVKSIYILNDESSVRLLNRVYKTNKYIYIPDPYVPLVFNPNLSTLNIEINNDIVYLHFGALEARKGTIEILKSIELLNSEILNNSIFIFAGKVNDDIKIEFYRLYDNLKTKAKIYVFDGFCGFDFVAELFVKSDVLLMPYKVVSHSSGMIGYAAQFNTPVLAPNKGLIGKLVRYYKLGYVISDVSPRSIAAFIKDNRNSLLSVPHYYMEKHTINNFLESIRFC